MRAVTRIKGMTQPPHELPTDLETAHQLIAELLETVRTQGRFIDKLQHQLEQLLRRIYGRKSEKLDPNQLLLFARELLEAAGDDPAATGEPTPAPPQETVPAAEPAPPKKPVTAASRCPSTCPAAARSTTSPPNCFRVPTAAPFASASARRSVSSSSTSRPAWW